MNYQTGTITATGAANGVTMTVIPPDTTVLISFSGTFGTVTMKVEGKDAQGNWFPLACVDAGTLVLNAGGSAFALTDNTAMMVQANVALYDAVRVYAAAIASGSVSVTMKSGNAALGAVTQSVVSNQLVSNVTSDLTIADAKDITVGTTTGTAFATNATQKIAFYGGTPVVQPSGTGELIGFTGNGATNANAVNFAANGNNGTKSYSLGDVVKALKNLGLMAAS